MNYVLGLGFVTFFIAFWVTKSLVPYLIKFGTQYNLLDKNEERKQISLNNINSEINKIEEKVVYLKLYLQENLTSNLAEKIVKEIRRTEKVIKDQSGNITEIICSYDERFILKPTY